MMKNLFVKLKNNRKLSYSEYGAPHGAPIFYFGGFPGSCRLGAKIYHDVAKANGYRLIGIDRPGMGCSSIDKHRSILSFAKDIEQFADALEINQFSIIGHSGGGPFVAACAYLIPHRLNGAAIVSGVAPLDVPGANIGMSRGMHVVNRLIQTIPWMAYVMMGVHYLAIKNTKAFPNKMLMQYPESDQNILRDPKKINLLLNASREAFRQGVGVPAKEIQLIVNPWGFKLEAINAPVYVFQGELDTQAPMSHAKIYADLIPGAVFKCFKGEGHLSAIDKHMEEIMHTVCA